MLRSIVIVLLILAVQPVLGFEQLAVAKPPAHTQIVRGADPVSPEDWPATLIFLTKRDGCTSTLVGSKVILTAAHCIGNGETGLVTIGDMEVSVTCDHHPKFRKGYADFALCLVTGEGVSGVGGELVSSALAYGRVSDQVMLTGYGCVKSGGRDRTFGVLHVGTATVTEVGASEGSNTKTAGGAALCFGDSGGPAYVQLANKARVIVGVNSQGDVHEVSILATTATPLFVDWALKWAKDHGVGICGLHPGLAGCRS